MPNHAHSSAQMNSGDSRNPRRAAAQVGNKNAKKGAKDAHFAMRCYRCDKAAWVKAATQSLRAGELDEEMRRGDNAMLPAWVVLTLNTAADRELGPVFAARRQTARNHKIKSTAAK